MPAWLLGPILLLAVLPVSLREPALTFLPDEPVRHEANASGTRTVYVWRGEFFDSLPAISEELREHGFVAKVDGNRCSAVFSRDDGTVIELGSGGWTSSPEGGHADHRDHEHLIATVKEAHSLAHWWAATKRRLGIK